MSIHEQARAEAEKRWPDEWDSVAAEVYGQSPIYRPEREPFIDGFLAGHEAATRTRVVTTVTELDALPVGSVVRAKYRAYIKCARQGWVGAQGVRVDSLTLSAFAPLTVLYDPEK